MTMTSRSELLENLMMVKASESWEHGPVHRVVLGVGGDECIDAVHA
jgi:hypothetical protein